MADVVIYVPGNAARISSSVGAVVLSSSHPTQNKMGNINKKYFNFIFFLPLVIIKINTNYKNNLNKLDLSVPLNHIVPLTVTVLVESTMLKSGVSK